MGHPREVGLQLSPSSFLCLNHFKVEHWVSVVSDSECCSPQLPWQLGKIRKPGEGKPLFHWAGRSPAQNSYFACLCACRDQNRPQAGHLLSWSTCCSDLGRRRLVGNRQPRDGGVRAKAELCLQKAALAWVWEEGDRNSPKSVLTTRCPGAIGSRAW